MSRWKGTDGMNANSQKPSAPILSDTRQKPDIPSGCTLEELETRLGIEQKIKDGAENLLQVFDTKTKKEDRDKKELLRAQVMQELENSSRKIEQIESMIDKLKLEQQDSDTDLLTQTDLQRTLPFNQSVKNLTTTHTVVTHSNNEVSQQSFSQSTQVLDNADLSIAQMLPSDEESYDDEDVADDEADVGQNTKQYSSVQSGKYSGLQNFEEVCRDLERACAYPCPETVNCANCMCNLLHNMQATLPKPLWMKLAGLLRRMLSFSITEITGCSFRILRLSLIKCTALQQMADVRAEQILARSLLANKDEQRVEREQAFLLFRCLCNAVNDTEDFSILMPSLRTIVSIAEQSGDPYRFVSLETLIELLVSSPTLLLEADCLRPVLHTLVDGTLSPNLAGTAIFALVHILDNPMAYKCPTLLTDIGLLWVPLTSLYKYHIDDRNDDSSDQSSNVTRCCIKVVSALLLTWPGLCTLFANDAQALKSLVDALRVPSFSARSDILDLFFSIFNIENTGWSESFAAGKRLTIVKTKASTNDDEFLPIKPNTHTNKCMSLSQHYIAFLLYVFLKLGLLDGIISMIKLNDDILLSRKATFLLGELLQMSDRYIPAEFSAEIQSLPSLFEMASRFNAEDRFVATSVLQSIEGLNRMQAQSYDLTAKKPHSFIFNKRWTDGSFRGQRQVEHVKIKMGLQLDDNHFRHILSETNVLTTRNYQKWQWDALVELLQGPLLSAKRLEEAMHATKFMRRLLGFYKPFSNRFSGIKNTKPNHKYIQVGCLLFSTLLANPEGVKYLAESKVLRQISEALQQLDNNADVFMVPLFSKHRLADTLSWGYFPMLGVLSSSKEGLSVLERWRIFTTLYHLSENPSCDYLTIVLLKHLDYRLEGHPRVLLSKTLVAADDSVRTEVTNFLSILLRSDYADSELQHWVIDLLILQLYDPFPEVCTAAVRLLNDASAESESLLEYIIQRKPSLIHLGDIGASLLLRFLATSAGFLYLSEIDYVQRELEQWHSWKNAAYVDAVEQNQLLAIIDELGLATDMFKPLESDVLPLHFYGELVKSPEGCELLRKTQHMEEFMSIIRKHSITECSPGATHQLKSALWTVGNIGKSTFGIPFLHEHKAIEIIIGIIETSPVASVRGTAFHVLGLISRNDEGLLHLRKHGWYTLTSLMSVSRGLCLPADFKRVFKPIYTPPIPNRCSAYSPNYSSFSQEEKEAVRLVANLSNHVLSNQSARKLTRLKSRSPDVFESREVIKACLQLLSNYHYRTQIRSFVYSFFQSPNFYRACYEDDVS
ncbi:hypothetical protein SJAG_04460 [Schizosaccharomyces japonicus yFS275]|uniref:Rictor n=1 Tax=Schizosaccharomyces japonicus (strain yFS275 / FY16936) TaxID=402676 RepID=B6K6W0_SCHJY|nr:hypothetical protein SJAG_04460 [Schizosaccharomyces japonicus yFS275]EEB09264.1 hypothetical protein SJAG_04460 [Schizosaccharomyces japonicus yFS275]